MVVGSVPLGLRRKGIAFRGPANEPSHHRVGSAQAGLGR